MVITTKNKTKYKIHSSRIHSSRIHSSRIHSSKISKKNKVSKGLILGCHADITPSILDGIKYTESINGNALQIFLGSKRSASLKTKTKLTEEDITEIRNYINHKQITLIIHSIYLLNFCTALPNSGHIRYMHDNLQYDLQIGAKIGTKCVIIHLGSTKDLEPDIAMKNLIANLNKIIRTKPAGIQLSLETSAGQGFQIGYTLEELAQIWNGVKHFGNKKVGICIDTAHVFVSGYDISSPSGITAYLERFNKLIGWKNITNFHINDSRYPSASRKDEHRGIGQGLIYNTHHGISALKYIKTFCQKRGIPMILETHGAGASDSEEQENGYKSEIELIRQL